MGLPHVFMGTTREHYLMLFGAAGVIGIVTGLIGAWIGAYFGARRAVKSAQLAPLANQLTAAQLTPVMQALDAIALEVERISEAQRFAARVLADRPSAGILRPEPRNITPH